MSVSRSWLAFFTTAAMTALGLALAAGQQSAPTAVYTTEQAAAGRDAYQASCAACHLNDLRGRNEAPALAGPNFMSAWGRRSTRELFEFISSTMPPGRANLPAEQYNSITAYLLQSNGAVAGTQPFAAVVATAGATIASLATGQVPDLAAAREVRRRASSREPARDEVRQPGGAPVRAADDEVRRRRVRAV